MTKPKITVCICTYRRERWLSILLSKLLTQETDNLFTYSIIVVDNDPHRSAESICLNHATVSTEIVYLTNPIKNLSLVRNTALNAAKSEWIALIDDDEFPENNWLLSLYKACLNYKADGALAPVRPYYESPPPNWVIASRIHLRPEPQTGHKLNWTETRTGNAMIKTSSIGEAVAPFDPRYNNGGEDQDFFRKMINDGCTFIWTNDAVVYEFTPSSRWKISILLKRALLRGRNTIKHGHVSPSNIAKSTIAVILYSFILLFTYPFHRHIFVRYAIKTCDHIGKILAYFKINPVTERAG